MVPDTRRDTPNYVDIVPQQGGSGRFSRPWTVGSRQMISQPGPVPRVLHTDPDCCFASSSVVVCICTLPSGGVVVVVVVVL